MSRFGGLSEERPSVFKTRSKLGTHLSTQCSGNERQSRPYAARRKIRAVHFRSIFTLTEFSVLSGYRVITQTNKHALIPVVINNSIEIQVLCDPCADITIIQQCCIPADAVIHPLTDGQFQVVDPKINPIEDVVLPALNTKILPSQAQLIPKFAKLSTIQQAQLDAVIGKFSDVFYSDDDNIGLCPYIEFKIDL
ncbi:hypothetical protein TNCV_4822471 [Trichonephila clavipes]|nr:hypothetical protein TNCV_4822471 [Trichonephila clavipes]